MNAASLLETLQPNLFALFEVSSELETSNDASLAKQYHSNLLAFADLARELHLRGLDHTARLLESGLKKIVEQQRDLMPSEADALVAWPELALTEVLGGAQDHCAWQVLHHIRKQAWVPAIPNFFVKNIEKLLTEDAIKFNLTDESNALSVEDALDALAELSIPPSVAEPSALTAVAPEIVSEIAPPAPVYELPRLTPLPRAYVIPVPTFATAPAADETVAHAEPEANGDALYADAPEADSEGKITAEEVAMLREALAEMHTEFAQPLNAAAALSTGDYSHLLEQYTEHLDHILNATSHLGMDGLQNIIAVVQVNAMAIQAGLPESLTPAAAQLLGGWLDCAVAHLDSVNDESCAQKLAAIVADAGWLYPAETDVLPEWVAALISVELIRARAAVDRASQALPEHVDLSVPADIDANVLNSLLEELPQHAQEFSSLVQRLNSGTGGTLEEMEQARRVAHTLKGAGNTVGVKGVGNLTHALEDILVAFGREQRLPTPVVRETLVEAADCLEAMSESLLNETAAPPESLAVYQKVLNWANQIDRDGLPDEDSGIANFVALQTSAELPPMATAPTREAGDDHETFLRVPASLIDSLLRMAGESAIITSQLQDRVAHLTQDLNTQRVSSRQIRQLSSELEQLVDVRGLAMVGGGKDEDGLDSLEMDQYNELHMLSRRIVESSADTREFSQTFEREVSGLRDLMAAKERVQIEIQRNIQRARMVEVSSIAPRLQRTVRQAARVLDRSVQLVIGGESALVDTNLLNQIMDPLMHMLRNAVDHGIEPDAVRIEAGKPVMGTIKLDFFAEGANIAVRCQDDGRGLNVQSIRAKALDAGLIQAEQTLTDAQVMRLITVPGFSTREEATLISGRGIGMDVVQRAVNDLRGSLELQSTLGTGTRFDMKFPVQLSATQVMISRSPQHLLAISERGVQQLLPTTGALEATADGGQVYILQDEKLPSVRLEQLLNLPYDALLAKGVSEVAMIVFDEMRQRYAVIVPELNDSRNVVVKPFNAIMPRTIGIDGATILGDGSVAVVIDLPDLLRAHNASATKNNIVENTAPRVRLPVCLIIDDSVSVRRTMEQLMQDTGYEVVSARDGLDALGTLQKQTPDIVLVDLEMPRMNGLEFTSAMRSRADTRETPVIMITSRFTDKHRQLAESAGVNAFLTKPYSEEHLLSTMTSLLKKVA